MLACLALFALSTLSPHEAYGKTTFVDCGGPQKKMTIEGGSVYPDPILYPGNVTVSAKVNVLDDLPASGLQMRLDLIKLDPYVMPVPCMKDIGSCSYDVCQMIQNHQDAFCPMFPSKAECKCPIKKNTYDMKNAPVVIPDFGAIFAKILQGHYNGTITFEDTNTKTEIGCIAVTFEIKSA